MSLLLCAAALLTLTALPAMAEETAEVSYTPVRIYVNGLLTARGYSDGESVFLSPEELCRYLGLSVSESFDEKSGSYVLSGDGFSLLAPKDKPYLQVNGRYSFAPRGVREIHGRLCLEAQTVAHIFGMKLEEEKPGHLDLSAEEIAPISGGEDYYPETFGKDNFYWLCRVISAEAANQCMEGQIGVGNVVLTRMKYSMFPDTAYDVIFQVDGVIQFESTSNGSIFHDPLEISEVAACLCIEGFNTVGNCTYFVNPHLADNSWFRRELNYVMTIEDHEFYS